jgi:hypothetical protein
MKTKIIILVILITNALLKAQPICNWAYIPVGTGFSQNNIYYSTTDQQNNIIEVGKLLGVADMNPSPALGDTSFSYPAYNYYISKIDASGQLLWIHYFQLNSQFGLFEFKGLKVDNANDIIVLGNFWGMVDFDLSANGVDTLRSHTATYPDFFVAKYDAVGNYKWAINLGDAVSAHISSQTLAIDAQNNILVSANPNGIVDVDPDDAVIHNTIGGNANIVCYDSNGNYLWNNRISTLYSYGISNHSLEVDALGNAYLMSVGYYELTVSKFSNTGTFLWGKKLGDFASGGRVTPQSLIIDHVTGNFTIAGTFGGTVDFDPNTGVNNKTNSNPAYEDGFIAQYDSSMQIIWVNQYAGNISFGSSSLFLLNNEIVAVGGLKDNIDFGNAISLSAMGNNSLHPFYVRLNNLGIAQEGFTLNGNGTFSTFNSLGGNLFVCTGYVTSNTDMDPSNSILTLNSTASNFFTAVYQSNTVTFNKKIVQESEISIYPNPAQANINIDLPAEFIGINYDMFDCIGNIVLSNSIKQKNDVIEISNLPKGVYFIKFQSDKIAAQKIVKQ